MEKRIFVRDLRPGMAVADIFGLAEARQGDARNGPFWGLKLQDASGRVDAKIWSPQSQHYPELPAGQVVFVEGQAQTFRDQIQLNVQRLQFLDPERDGVDIAWLYPASPEPAEAYLERIEELCRQHLRHKPWRKLVRRVLGDPEIRPRLLRGIGGKVMHHAYVGGLLEHTWSVCRLCMAFCDLYPSLDREALLAAAVLHDLGKAWELTGGLANDYTDQGRLLGHMTLGLEAIEPHIRRSGLEPELETHLKHLVLSHHGRYEYQSPRLPHTPEAFALHYADNLDAKMNQVYGAFQDCDPDGSSEPMWTPYQKGLDRQLYRAARTPEADPPRRPDKPQPKDSQCSLPLKA